MSTDPTSTPDLASILKTLAGLSQSSQAQIQEPLRQQLQPQSNTWTPPLQVQGHHQQPPQDYANSQQQWSNYPTQQLHESYPVKKQFPPQVSKQVETIDPTIITEWSVGLRCVMRTVSKHDQLLNEIKKMIKSQHDHEDQWWRGREDLIQRQLTRVEGQKKLDEILKGLGGLASDGISNATPEALASELRTFDMKVHRAQLQMVREWSAKLRNLGVPFFGTNSSLVIPFGKGEVTPGDGGRKLEKGMIHEGDLLELQRKMLSILQDMCKD